MAAPIALAPIAWTALRLGAVAAVTIYLARARSVPKDPRQEAVLDDLPEGLDGGPHSAEGERGLNGAGRFRRVIRLGVDGPGIEVDAALLGRFRIRRV